MAHARSSWRAGLPRLRISKRWLLVSVLITAAVMLLVIMLRPPALDRAVAGVAQWTTGEAPAECAGPLAAEFDCHRERYEHLVWDAGAPAALAAIKDDYEVNDTVKGNCHQLVHAIGRAAGERYGDVPGAFGQGDRFCGGGYYHGAMEVAVARLGADRTAAGADELCASVRDERAHGLYHYECAHGLGHGFLRVLDHELFAALAICDALADAWERAPCHGGVFMENIMAAQHAGHPAKYLRDNDPLYPCTAVDTRYKAQCFPVQTSHALQLRGDDFAAVFPLCAQIEAEFQHECYRGLGGYAAIVSINTYLTNVGQVEAANMLCAQAPDHAARSSCIMGAVVTLLDYGDDVRATAFCATLDVDLAPTCLQTRERFLAKIREL